MSGTPLRAAIVATVVGCVLGGGVASAISFSQFGYSQHIVAAIPGGPSNNFGGLVAASDGNIYVVGGFRTDAFRVTPSGIVTALTLGQSTLLGVGAIGSTLYVGADSGGIWTFDISLASPTATLLTTVPGNLNGNGNSDFAVAPAGFGSFGGQLISCNGGVYAINPGTGAKTNILVDTGTHHSSLDFGPTGVLYVADYDNARLLTVSSTGTTSVLATLAGAIDGVAVHQGTGMIYVADSQDDMIWQVTPTGGISSFATGAIFDGGYYPTGFGFSPDGTTLYYLTNEGPGFQLAAITGFAGNQEPIPAAGVLGWLTLAVLVAAAGAVALRRVLA